MPLLAQPHVDVMLQLDNTDSIMDKHLFVLLLLVVLLLKMLIPTELQHLIMDSVVVMLVSLHLLLMELFHVFVQLEILFILEPLQLLPMPVVLLIKLLIFKQVNVLVIVGHPLLII